MKIPKVTFDQSIHEPEEEPIKPGEPKRLNSILTFTTDVDMEDPKNTNTSL